MSIWAVIPAKSPAEAKTRLAPILSPAERAALARRLLAGTVRAALAAPPLRGAVVVSASAELRVLASRLGAQPCPDPAPPVQPCPDPAPPLQPCPDPTVRSHDALNAAIAQGCRHAAALGATAALVLPADLPLLDAAAIVEFLDEAGDAAVALAPDRAGTGTNALLLRPPLSIAPAFGPDSLARHRAAARARGLSVATVRLPTLAFDVDTPRDLALLYGTCAAGTVARV